MENVKVAALKYALTFPNTSAAYIECKLYGKFKSVLNIMQCSAIAEAAVK